MDGIEEAIKLLIRKAANADSAGTALMFAQAAQAVASAAMALVSVRREIKLEMRLQRLEE